MIQQDPWIGKTLGNCRIEKLIGKGAMSDVYLAHYLKLGIPVAIKIVSFINESEQRAKRFQKRFLQEVQFISKLEHPNIVKVYNAGEEDGYWYMIMEYVAGINLLKMIESKGHLSVKETLFFMHEIVSALKVSHEKGIIHRDIKPGNILITPTGHCKLVDFGLAKGTNIDASISHEGQIVGTIFYISPEQAIGSKQVDCRTDFYSLGVTLFQMLTGKLPYPGRTPIQVIQQHLEAPIPSVRDFNPEIPEILDQIIKKMMAKKPSQRYASANQILEQISLCYLPVKTKQRRFSKSYKYVGLIFSLLLLVFFTYLFKPVKNSKPLGQNIPAIQQIHKQQKENPGLITTQIETQFPETPKNKVVRLEIIPNNIRLQVHQSIQFTIKAYNEWNELVECDPFWISSGGNLVENKKTATFTAGKLEGRFIINVRDQNTWIQTQATVEITNLEQETGWFGELIPKGMRKSSIRGEYFYIKDDSIMMYVPAGDFWSGDNSGNEDEQPAKLITLDGYYIDKYELTWAKYKEYCKITSQELPPEPNWKIQLNHPVVNISWSEAKKYAEWAGKRLPTEAEWEKAARGGIYIPNWMEEQIPIRTTINPYPRRTYPWGNLLPHSNGFSCNYVAYDQWEKRSEDGYENTAPIGSFPQGTSPYKIHDMAGNVWEWCIDNYDKIFYQTRSDSNPVCLSNEENFVVRGGSWYNHAEGCRTSRRAMMQNERFPWVGVRFAK